MSTAACLLRLWVWIPLGAWKSVCCECCVLSGRGLCDEMITRPEESYRLWCVVVCDLETSRMRSPWPAFCLSATGKKNSCQKKENRLNRAVNSKKFYFFKKFGTYLCLFRNCCIAPTYMRRLPATSVYRPKWQWQYNFLWVYFTEGKQKCKVS